MISNPVHLRAEHLGPLLNSLTGWPAAKAEVLVASPGHRDCGADHPLTCTAEAEYRSEAYLARTRAAVANAPRLMADQCSRLGVILMPVVTIVDTGSVLPEQRDAVPTMPADGQTPTS